MRAAVRNLVARGLVEIRRGRGTFVLQPRITQELTELTGFVEDMQVAGRQASARVLAREEVAADAEVADRLQVALGAPVTRIRRVRLADGSPVSLDETWLPADLGRQVVTDDLEAEPIFALLEDKYGTVLVEADYQLEAVAATEEVAHPLGVLPGAPIFLIQRTTYTVDERPVDHERLYYRGDAIRFITRLTRGSRGRGVSS